MTTVFNKEIDERLLTFEGDFEEAIYKKYDSINLSDIIYHKEENYDNMDKKLIDNLKKFNINLNQPVIAHICNTCDFGDYLTIIMNKNFYLGIGYYSAGPNLAHFSIYKWKEEETEFFDEDLEFINLEECINVKRNEDEDGPITLI